MSEKKTELEKRKMRYVHVTLETKSGILHRIVSVVNLGTWIFLTNSDEEFSCKTGKRYNGPDLTFGRVNNWRACSESELRAQIKLDPVWSVGLSATIPDADTVPRAGRNFYLLRPDNFARFCFRQGIERTADLVKIPTLDKPARVRL